MHTHAMIVGGGIAGLLAAWKLEKTGVPYVLLEAKEQLGGRILGEAHTHNNADASTHHYHDLGPTWIFPHQHKIRDLLTELDIKWFDQFADGDALFQPAGEQPVTRMAGAGAASMFRIEGGITELINRLESKLSRKSLKTSHPVVSVTRTDQQWQITATHHNQSMVFSCDQLVLAIPPRMITQHLSAERWASQTLLQALSATPTWMAAQAKFVASYAKPFWREQGLSGQAFSQRGPMQEMHDASDKHGHAHALFGFIGIPASYRQQLSQAQLKQACISQLVSLYGEEAANTEQCFMKDWAQDPWAASPLDLSHPPAHPFIDLPRFKQELTDKKIHLVASEFARQEAGYIEGAIYAVNDMLINI